MHFIIVALNHLAHLYWSDSWLQFIILLIGSALLSTYNVTDNMLTWFHHAKTHYFLRWRCEIRDCVFQESRKLFIPSNARFQLCLNLHTQCFVLWKQGQALYPENFNLNFESEGVVVKLLLYYSCFNIALLQTFIFQKKLIAPIFAYFPFL